MKILNQNTMKRHRLTETDIIANMKKQVKENSPSVAVGIGDDCAVINYGPRQYLLVTTDTLVESVHFKQKWSTAEQIGAKSVEQNVSDIAAMGGKPSFMLVSFIIPKVIKKKYIETINSAIIKRSKKYKIEVVGGNVSAGKELSISITLFGFVDKRKLCLRSGAKINDLVCVTGSLGGSAAGLYSLQKNKKTGAIKSYLEPKAQLKSGQELAKCGVNSMIDISDGLGTDLQHICDESGVGALIFKEDIPISKITKESLRKLKKDLYDFALYGGEDFELLFTASKKQLDKIHRNKKIKFTVVGTIVSKKEGIFLLDNGKKRKLKAGFEHFRT